MATIIIYLLLKVIEVYNYILIGYVLLTWLPALHASAIGRAFDWLVEPILRPFRRLSLQFLGLDWTVVAVWFCLRCLSQLLLRLYFLM